MRPWLCTRAPASTSPALPCPPMRPPSTSILKPSSRGTVTTLALFTAASNTYLQRASVARQGSVHK